MIGDLYLKIKLFIKQNFLCIHKYKRFHCGLDYQYIQCIKCGKLTDNYNLLSE